MNYDNMILGVGNINHPANQREDQLEEFESNNLAKCLDYAKETKDFEYIENAIIDQNVIIENEALSIARVISSFFKKLFRIHYYRFQKPIWGSLKGSTKYHLSITFFNKWSLNFRIMNQDNSFFFRNEELYMLIQGVKQRNIKF